MSPVIVEGVRCDDPLRSRPRAGVGTWVARRLWVISCRAGVPCRLLTRLRMVSMSSPAPVATPAESARAGHPKGLYVLFATEMWERFSFYTMIAMFTLYMRDATEGFGWTADRATGLYANYTMFVYASPLVGGWIADRKLGFRRAVMVGAVFFMAGHILLSFHSLTAVYTALTCLVVGNGFFKPNVSAMVGGLYPEGSRLKDKAY